MTQAETVKLICEALEDTDWDYIDCDDNGAGQMMIMCSKRVGNKMQHQNILVGTVYNQELG